MTYSIHVTHSNDPSIHYKKVLTEEEFLQLKTVKSRKAICGFTATLIPVRTYNLQCFAKDLFVPTVIKALKVEQLALKVLAILASFVIDAATLPIRLLTCIPRVISNACKKQHSLKKHLIQEAADSKLINSEHVKVMFEWQKRVVSGYETDDQGRVRQNYSNECHYERKNINFVQVPAYSGSSHTQAGIR